ncbi:MAG: methionine--tRNA ligase [Brevinematales bacterium]|nr:methionine--tRNA ligase [Brevinematales bacterium]
MARYLVTSALPYANGPIHLGHLAGAYLPADIYVRYLKLNGDEVVYVCGTDEHGVPITLRAEQEGVSPAEVVARYHNHIKESFAGMRIDFDNFSGTSRPHHYRLSQQFFLDLYQNGYITKHKEKQFYDEEKKRFLADRYIEGTCPHCGYERARGDQCDKCGKLLNPDQLINPKSVLSHTTPVQKETEHWYLDLAAFSERLEKWIFSKTHWKDNVRNFVLGWIQKEGLKERAITRDLDWGVPVPLEEAKGKVLYVWFDAPIGYISSTIEWAEKIGKPEEWKKYWLSPDTRLVHFIGKDNIPFHAIIWPAMIMGQNTPYVLPYDIPANEYLTLEGEKFSTSMNWAVWVDEYLEYFPPDPLRYYLAANAPENKDADFAWKAFQQRNNEELANILGNFINRTLTFVKNHADGEIKPVAWSKEDEVFWAEVREKTLAYAALLSRFQVREATKTMMDIARLGNRYYDEQKPWILRKENPERLGQVLSVCVHLCRLLAVVMYPLMPDSALKLWRMVGETRDILYERWATVADYRMPARKIGEIEILFVKYDDELIQKQINRLIQKSQKVQEKPMESQTEQLLVTIEDFKRFDLRVAEIVEVMDMPKSNKLYKLKVKVGDTEKQILAGIKQHYAPEELKGKKIVIINNLQPAKLMGEVSEGMLLAASDEGKTKVIFLTPEKDIESGAKIS